MWWEDRTCIILSINVHFLFQHSLTLYTFDNFTHTILYQGWLIGVTSIWNCILLFNSLSFLSECQRDRFTNLPPNVTYVPLGGNVTVTCTNPDLNPNNLIVRRLNPNENLQCTSNPMCTLDVDSGMFTLHNFQSSYNGTYQFDYIIIFPRTCRVNFDIIEAGKFKLYILHLCSWLPTYVSSSLITCYYSTGMIYMLHSLCICSGRTYWCGLSCHGHYYIGNICLFNITSTIYTDVSLCLVRLIVSCYPLYHSLLHLFCPLWTYRVLYRTCGMLNYILSWDRLLLS